MNLPTQSSMTWTMDVGNGNPRTTVIPPHVLSDETEEMEDCSELLTRALNLFIRRMERTIRVQNKPVCPVQA